MSKLFSGSLGRPPSTRENNHKSRTRGRRLRSERLETRQLLAANLFHNELLPEDVNEDGQVTALDALTVINQMNRRSDRDAGPDGDHRGQGRMTDVNNDGRDTALDALMIINRLNRGRGGPGEEMDRPGPPGDHPINERPDRPTHPPGNEETPPAEQTETDVVLQWNDVFGEVLVDSTENQNPGYASRAQAILNLAIYDAISIAENGRDAETFYDYSLDSRGKPNHVDAEAAASQAAYTVLSALYPDQQARLDEALRSSLTNIGRDANTGNGRALGTDIANEILAIRADDGWDAEADYTYVDEIGSFQPDPLNPDVPAWGPAWGEVETFAVSAAEDFRPETTPPLNSEQYAASYNEVFELGSVDSTVRTAEQTEIGIFWAYDREGLGTPMALFNDILQTVAIQEGNTLEENAALFAQASVAMADAGIVAWNTKFGEEFWRPVTAIHQGDDDGNALTEGDADWVALGAPDGGEDEIGFTPQFPTYVSGHATFGAALFGSLQEFYGTDDISFDVTSEELEILLEDPELQAAYGLDLDDATRTFSSFSEAMAENGRSRVYLGIHFDFDDTVGQEVGQAVASSVASEFVASAEDDGHDHRDRTKPRPRPHGDAPLVNMPRPSEFMSDADLDLLAQDQVNREEDPRFRQPGDPLDGNLF